MPLVQKESSDPSSQPTAVRYLEKFFLEVIVQENNNRVGENGRIYPPRLTIRYTSRDPKLSGQAGVTNPAEFRVSYSMDKVPPPPVSGLKSFWVW